MEEPEKDVVAVQAQNEASRPAAPAVEEKQPEPPAPASPATAATPEPEKQQEVAAQAEAPPEPVAKPVAKARVKRAAPRAQPVEPQETESPQQTSEEPVTSVVVIPPEEPSEGTAPAREELPRPRNGRVEIVFQGDLPGLETKGIELEIDHTPVAERTSASGLDTRHGIVLYSGELTAGTHPLNLRVNMTGNGKVFSYVNDYNFTIKHNATLGIEADGTTRVQVNAVTEGGITRPWAERVALKVTVSRENASQRENAS